MRNILDNIFSWIKNDFSSNPFRFVIECVAWSLSVAGSVVLAITVNAPALYVLYPMWITGCILYAWCAYTRKSFGMLGNYFLLATIDVIGFVRLFA